MALVQILVDKLTGHHRGTTFSLAEANPTDQIKDFTIDATLTENHTSEASITENPVEEGVVITDHISLKADSYTLTGVISDTPLDLSASIKGAATSVGALVGKKIVGPLGAYAGVGAGAYANLLTGGSGNRMKNAFDHLKNIQTSRVKFTVVTGLMVYENMVLTTLTVNRDNKSGRSFNFSATLKQIRIVKSQVIDIPNVPRAVKNAASTKDLGKQAAEKAEKNNATLAKQFKNYVSTGIKNTIGFGGN